MDNLNDAIMAMDMDMDMAKIEIAPIHIVMLLLESGSDTVFSLLTATKFLPSS